MEVPKTPKKQNTEYVQHRSLRSIYIGKSGDLPKKQKKTKALTNDTIVKTLLTISIAQLKNELHFSSKQNPTFIVFNRIWKNSTITD